MNEAIEPIGNQYYLYYLLWMPSVMFSIYVFYQWFFLFVELFSRVTATNLRAAGNKKRFVPSYCYIFIINYSNNCDHYSWQIFRLSLANWYTIKTLLLQRLIHVLGQHYYLIIWSASQHSARKKMISWKMISMRHWMKFRRVNKLISSVVCQME